MKKYSKKIDNHLNIKNSISNLNIPIFRESLAFFPGFPLKVKHDFENHLKQSSIPHEFSTKFNFYWATILFEIQSSFFTITKSPSKEKINLKNQKKEVNNIIFEIWDNYINNYRILGLKELKIKEKKDNIQDFKSEFYLYPHLFILKNIILLAIPKKDKCLEEDQSDFALINILRNICFSYEEIFPMHDSVNSLRERKDKLKSLLHSETGLFHKKQPVISYIFDRKSNIIKELVNYTKNTTSKANSLSNTPSHLQLSHLQLSHLQLIKFHILELIDCASKLMNLFKDNENYLSITHLFSLYNTNSMLKKNIDDLLCYIKKNNLNTSIDSFSSLINNVFKKNDLNLNSNNRYFDILLFGDSISAGANSSSLLKLPPYQPDYGELVSLIVQNCLIKEHSKSPNLNSRNSIKVRYLNHSEGGKTSYWGKKNIDSKIKLIEKEYIDFQYDLVILAWGMNDSSAMVNVKRYTKNLISQMKKIWKKT